MHAGDSKILALGAIKTIEASTLGEKRDRGDGREPTSQDGWR